MSRNLDPHAAAEEIRHAIIDRPSIPPEARHMQTFVEQVCRELGIQPDAVNCMAVAEALHDADIKPHLVQEYPKMLVDADSKPVPDEHGKPIIFRDEAEENAYGAGLTKNEATDALKEAQYNEDDEVARRQAVVDQQDAERKAAQQRDAERKAERGSTGNQTPAQPLKPAGAKNPT